MFSFVTSHNSFLGFRNIRSEFRVFPTSLGIIGLVRIESLVRVVLIIRAILLRRFLSTRRGG